MQPEERDTAYLWDMREAAQVAMSAAQETTFEQFLSGHTVERLAIERCIEVIGEAARRVSAAFRAAHPEIPCSKIIAQRNAIAHEYDQIEYDKIWESVTVSAPDLIEALDSLIPPPPGD